MSTEIMGIVTFHLVFFIITHTGGKGKKKGCFRLSKQAFSRPVLMGKMPEKRSCESKKHLRFSFVAAPVFMKLYGSDPAGTRLDYDA
jgi:hypothetical protein